MGSLHLKNMPPMPVTLLGLAWSLPTSSLALKPRPNEAIRASAGNKILFIYSFMSIFKLRSNHYPAMPVIPDGRNAGQDKRDRRGYNTDIGTDQTYNAHKQDEQGYSSHPEIGQVWRNFFLK
ncbi:hypothetical protein D3C86_1554990 [compost metagenome]